MAEHGGYRRPGNPAPVSGPGALSRRTDGGPGGPRAMEITGQSYGENQSTNAAQSAAPLATSRPSPAPVQMPTPIHAPTADPNEPVTAGADAGPGPTSADIGLARESNAELRAKFGDRLPVLMRMADAPYATAAYRRQVRQLIARINS